MKNFQLAILISLFTFTMSYGQETETETINTGEVINKVTITETEMYDGSDSPIAREYFSEAIYFSENNELNKAKLSYLKAINEDLSYIEAYDNLGLICRKLEQYDEAIKYYSKSIELMPDGMLANQNIAVVYTLKQDYDSAIKTYQNITEFAPESPEGYFGLSSSYMVTQKFDLAIENGKKALEIYKAEDSHHIGDGYLVLGYTYHYKGDNESARPYIQAAKEVGARVNPDIEKAVMGEVTEAQKEYTEEDYRNSEQGFLDAYNWTLETPIDKNQEQRTETNAALLEWMSGNPYISIELNEKVIKYISDDPQSLMIFMGGWTQYAIETKEYKNKEAGCLAGLEKVIQFYNANKKSTGKIKGIEKLLKLQKKNELKDLTK